MGRGCKMGGAAYSEYPFVNYTGVAKSTLVVGDKVFMTLSGLFDKLPTPESLPTDNSRGVAWSPDGTIQTVVHDASPYVTNYDRTADGRVKHASTERRPPGH